MDNLDTVADLVAITTIERSSTSKAVSSITVPTSTAPTSMETVVPTKKDSVPTSTSSTVPTSTVPISTAPISTETVVPK